jgi:glutathione S-transferase
MTPYRIFGSELSPYSVKVRSYFRYKGIPHEWVVRNASNMDEFRRHARLPLIPLVLTPEGEALQDSTPILERVEAAHPEPSIHPPEPVAAFVSALLEEYGDEWGNKAMFHYRWTYEPDQVSAAARKAAAGHVCNRGDPAARRERDVAGAGCGVAADHGECGRDCRGCQPGDAGSDAALDAVRRRGRARR